MPRTRFGPRGSSVRLMPLSSLLICGSAAGGRFRVAARRNVLLSTVAWARGKRLERSSGERWRREGAAIGAESHLVQRSATPGEGRRGTEHIRQAGGHWFEPSTAHTEIPAQAGFLCHRAVVNAVEPAGVRLVAELPAGFSDRHVEDREAFIDRIDCGGPMELSSKQCCAWPPPSTSTLWRKESSELRRRSRCLD